MTTENIEGLPILSNLENKDGGTPPLKKKSKRTQYLREWRHKNSDKVRKNRRTSYANNPEKYRKKSRDTYQKNKGHDWDDDNKNGKINDRLAVNSAVSPTKFFKFSYIKKLAKEEVYNTLDGQFTPVDPLYRKIRKEEDGFIVSSMFLLKETNNNPSTKQINKIFLKFSMLKDLDKRFMALMEDSMRNKE